MVSTSASTSTWILKHPQTTAAFAAEVATATAGRDRTARAITLISRCYHVAITLLSRCYHVVITLLSREPKDAPAVALDREYNGAKLTHNAYESMWKCGELEHYFFPYTGGCCFATQINTDQHKSTQINTNQYRSTHINADQHRSTQIHADQHRSTHINTDQHRSTQTNTDHHRSTHINTDQHRST